MAVGYGPGEIQGRIVNGTFMQYQLKAAFETGF